MMNERIRELAEQVGFGPAWFEESQPGYPALPKEGMLKEFAELIVQECITQARSEEDRFYGLGADDLALTMEHFQLVLKQHFGVKE